MRNILLIILILPFSNNTFAYIDPGSGSLLLQGILAAIASLTTVLGIYYARIKQFFSRKSREEDQADNDETPENQRK